MFEEPTDHPSPALHPAGGLQERARRFPHAPVKALDSYPASFATLGTNLLQLARDAWDAAHRLRVAVDVILTVRCWAAAKHSITDQYEQSLVAFCLELRGLQELLDHLAAVHIKNGKPVARRLGSPFPYAALARIDAALPDQMRRDADALVAIGVNSAAFSPSAPRTWGDSRSSSIRTQISKSATPRRCASLTHSVSPSQPSKELVGRGSTLASWQYKAGPRS